MEEVFQQEKGHPLRKVMFAVNSTEPQSEGHTDDILCQLTEEFNNDELCDPKINPNFAKAIIEVWGKHLKPENCDQLSPTLVNMETLSNILAHNNSQDVKLRKMQKFLLEVITPL